MLITNENIETNVSQPVDNKPPVLKMPGASSYVPPKPIVIKKSSSMGGVLVLITLIGLCGLGVYLVSSGKMIKISSGEDQNSKTVITKKIYVNGAGNNDKPSEENLKSPIVDESVPFKMPGPSEEDFELTKEDKDRSLKFLISEELSKREIVYDSFRELGDQFKETYENSYNRLVANDCPSFLQRSHRLVHPNKVQPLLRMTTRRGRMLLVLLL